MSDNRNEDYYDAYTKKNSSANKKSGKGKTGSGNDVEVSLNDFEEVFMSNSDDGSKGSSNSKPSAQQKPSGSKNGKKKKKKKRKILKRIIIALILLFLAGCIAVGVMVASVIFSAEKIDPNEIYSKLTENSIMYDNDDNMIENVMDSQLRTNLEYSEMPKQLIDAFVAIEDKTFWDHNGFNIIRIGGAIVESIKSGEPIGGTSTITQQLARNVFLEDQKSQHSMKRKITEAYYTVILEKNLTKEQIIEAYLNTIYLGFNTYGVGAAAQTYFGKDAMDLNLAECAALASIPKNPNKHALIKRLYSEEVDPANPNIIATQGEYSLVYNDAFKSRQGYALKFMVEAGTATQEEADAANAFDIKSSLNPPTNINSSQTTSSYYTDYAVDEAIEILMRELDIDEAKARTMLYTGGLQIYTSLDRNTQNIIEEEYNKKGNFPSATSFRKDGQGNMLKKGGGIVLYNQNNYFESDGSFKLRSGEFEYDGSGNLKILKGKRLAFYNVKNEGKVVDTTINFKPIYAYIDGALHISSGGVINVEAAAKSVDGEGNLIVSKSFLDANPYNFVNNGDSVTIPAECFYVNAMVIQPQSAMVVMNQHTGFIMGMVGGRNIEGSKLYNRADSARQPGSSIKPLAVYSEALLEGFTASSNIPDAPVERGGKPWPSNSYKGYMGDISLQRAVQRSSNAAAVRTLEHIGYDNSVKMMEKLGITTLVDEDKSSAALALGGLTYGLKPIESAGAYATIANGGTYYKPTTIRKILNRNGETLYIYKIAGTKAMDEGTAFCMTDILKSVVTGGTGGRARISGMTVAGKTGTTTKNYDAWFCGFTPYYTAVVWIGNDYNIQLSNGSGAAASLWSRVMSRVHEGYAAKQFEVPNSVEGGPGSYHVKDRKRLSLKSEGKALLFCSQSNMLAGPDCPSTFTKMGNASGGYCTIHAKAPLAGDDEGADPNAGGNTPPPSGGDTPPPSGGDTPPPSGGDTPPPSGGDTPPPSGGDTPPPSGGDTPPVVTTE